LNENTLYVPLLALLTTVPRYYAVDKSGPAEEKRLPQPGPYHNDTLFFLPPANQVESALGNNQVID
jgi:hypothetical protein